MNERRVEKTDFDMINRVIKSLDDGEVKDCIKHMIQIIQDKNDEIIRCNSQMMKMIVDSDIEYKELNDKINSLEELLDIPRN